MTDDQRYVRPRYAWLIAATLAVGVFAANIGASVSLAGGDTLWSVPVAYSVIHERNVTLDEFPDLVAVTKTHTKVLSDGHRVSVFPWGPSIASAPMLAAYDAWLHLRGSSLREYIHTHFAAGSSEFPDATLENRLASVYVAASTVVLFFLLLRRTRSRLLAVLVSLAFAFGTSMFSTVSRALWSHAPSVFALVVALYFLQVFEERVLREPQLTRQGAVLAAACGAALGTAYCMRPTSAVPLLVVVAAFVRQWRAGLAALAGAAIPILAMVGLDYATLGQPLQSYYEAGRGDTQAGGSFLVGLAGDLVSPARGLLIWSPFILLALPAGVRAMHHPVRDRVLTICVVVAVLHCLTIATLKPWWAGWSVGPRLFSDALPFLMLLVADGVLFLRARLRSWIRPAIATGAVLVAFSLFTNVRAATHFSVQLWNVTPQNVDTHSDRPWDWSDPQFLPVKRVECSPSHCGDRREGGNNLHRYL